MRRGLLAAGLACVAVLAAEDGPAVVEPVLAGLEDVPPVVARVDERPVTRRELVRELVGSSGGGALDRIVRRTLVEQAAAQAGIRVTAEELEAQLQLDEKALPNEMTFAPWDVGEKTFENIIRARFQMSLADYRDLVVRQRLLARKAVGLDVRPGEPVLRRFFNEHPELFQPQARYRAAHVLITPLNPRDLNLGARLRGEAALREQLLEERRGLERWRRDHNVDMRNAPALDTGPEWEECHTKALKCISELQAGRISWEQAVERYSQDPHDQRHPKDGKTYRQRLRPPLSPGEVGWFTESGPMVREFYAGAKGLKPGEVSAPVRTKFGFHIIKLLEVVEQPRKTYEELREVVERAFVERVISARTEQWMEDLVRQARLDNTRALLWPPDPKAAAEEADPVVGRVNDAPLKRSEVWKELLRADGPDALNRLINREIALGPLQRMGPEKLEWLGLPPAYRSPQLPPDEPIPVTPEEVDLELNDERLALDRENEERKKNEPAAAPRSFDQFVADLYGQTVAEYRRSLKAGLILSKAIRRRVRMDNATLLVEFTLARELYAQPAGFQAEHLLIPLAPQADAKAKADAEAMAQDLRDQLIAGKTTWDDAVNLNPGNVPKTLGILRPGTGTYSELYPALVASNLEKGQYSMPLRSKAGYHLIKIINRLPERIPEFEELRPQVERDYLRARGTMFLDVWLRSMQKLARIQRYLFAVESLVPPDNFPLPKQGK